jgi:hypothetical protein
MISIKGMQKAAGAEPVQLVWRAAASCRKEVSRINSRVLGTCVTFQSQTSGLGSKDDRHVSFFGVALHRLPRGVDCQGSITPVLQRSLLLLSPFH